MVSQGDFGAAQFFCSAVENAAAQAAAQRTSRFAFVQYAFNGGVGLVVAPPDWSATAAGLIPRLRDSGNLLVYSDRKSVV